MAKLRNILLFFSHLSFRVLKFANNVLISGKLESLQYDLTLNREMSFCSNTINSTTNENISDKIHKQKLNNPKNIIIGHLNIKSLRNKIDFTRILFGKYIDILLLSETKLDPYFPERQFSIDGFRTFRKDRNQNGGGLIIYVNRDLACKVIDLNIINTEYISIELTAKNKEWLIIGIIGTSNHK